MGNNRFNLSEDALSSLCWICENNNYIPPESFSKYSVKRGLRNSDGSGVVAGVTNICNVHGYMLSEGEIQPIPGKLIYRGIDISDIINGCVEEDRFGFEETVWLLLFGQLPTKTELDEFRELLSSRELPRNFTDDVIIKTPSPNIMNKMARSVLSLYSYDKNPEDISLRNVIGQSIRLIAQLPSIMNYSYQVKRRAYDHESMYIHPSDPCHSMAEFILASMRPDQSFTKEEARLLDICLILHAEHGGGNNSTFAARVLSSSGTDTYSAIAGAIGSLKGPKHGGANIKVMEMLHFLKRDVKDYTNENAVKEYLRKLLQKEAGDRSGLIYGMGHAVYTLSDPRAILLKKYAKQIAAKQGFGDDFAILEMIERLTPDLLNEIKNDNKSICANVDLYSGLVYRALGIPEELFTPLFAVGRLPGWCAHRIEEISTGGRIIRPAYKPVAKSRPYTHLSDRN